MSAKKYDVHYSIEETDQIVAFTADEAAEIVMEDQGPSTKVISVTLAEGEDVEDEEPPDDEDEEDDDDSAYGHGV